MTYDKRSIHLICNAHLDPIWLWEWEEGAAEAISTFRVAADFCEKYPGFVFNHNEVILYQWVEEYEPALFRRIQRLVAQGRWHIMGGWFLQPDCNMPSTEAMARQAIDGRRYFDRKFGVRPTTAINFDPFGHAAGIPQILAGSGYDSYVFCRPSPNQCALPAEIFRWVAPDGSSVAAARGFGSYLTLHGKARGKVEAFIENRDEPCGLVLWGIGNHGGGPSHKDLCALNDLIDEHPELDMRHSTPEACFEEIRLRGADLPVHQGDLNLWAPGCYTSMAEIKRRYRQIENHYFATEKMAAAAWAQGLMDYPQAELDDARRDMLTGQFHDILPGSSIQPAEEAALRMLDHGLEILSRLKARAFFALASGQTRPRENRIPVLVYNPHPFDIETLVTCEFNLPNQNREGTCILAHAHQGRKALPTQVEQELSNVPVDWRKRVVFPATLKAGQMNRFDCTLEEVSRKPAPKVRARNGKLRLRTGDLEFVLNARSGLVERLRIQGRDLVKPRAFLPVVVEDHEDPWAGDRRSFPKRIGAFKAMSRERVADFTRASAKNAPGAVRVVEDGPVRTVFEVLMEYHDSQIVMRYCVPRAGTEIEVEARVFWNEKQRMLKLEIPTPDAQARYVGQVIGGRLDLPADGTEAVAQRWTAVVSDSEDAALTVVNDRTYGSDLRRGRLRLSLLRGPIYSSLTGGNPIAKPIANRYMPHIDQGERIFRFWVSGGAAGERLGAIEREAMAHAEAPFALSFYPQGGGRLPRPLAVLSDKACVATAVKKADDGNYLVVRLFEPTGKPRTTTLRLPAIGAEARVKIGGFELKTIRISPDTGDWSEVNLLEETLQV